MNRRGFLQVVTGLAASAVIAKIPRQEQKQEPKETTENPDLFVALFNGSCEVSGNGYHRAKMKCNAFHFNPEGFLVNDENAIFSQAKSKWGKITHFALSAKSAKGNELFSIRGTVANSPTITNGDIVQFPAGDLQIEL